MTAQLSAFYHTTSKNVTIIRIAGPGAGNRSGSRDAAAVVPETILFTLADPRRRDVIDEDIRNGSLQCYRSMFAAA